MKNLQMSTLDNDSMLKISGGSWKNIVDGVCTGVGVAALLGGICPPLIFGCAGWSVYRLF